MPICSHARSCELYAQFSIKASLRVWTLRYCEGDQDACQRHRTLATGKPVPPTLLPNGKLLKVGHVLSESAPRAKER
jgi:hypothetical protein